MRGEEDRLVTHLAMMLSGGDVPRLVDVVTIMAVAIVIIVAVILIS